jgi:hypothetical protein
VAAKASAGNEDKQDAERMKMTFGILNFENIVLVFNYPIELLDPGQQLPSSFRPCHRLRHHRC